MAEAPPSGDPVTKPEVVDDIPRMKYSPREPVATPRLGKVNKVKTVGLGKLTVETANGYTNV